MQNPNQTGLENAGKELGGAFQGALSWKWDSRFEAVLAEFAAGKKESIRAILERSLGNTWDSSNIGNAPDIVREINSHLGGLRPGQLLFTSDPDRELLFFVPGGHGTAVRPSLYASRHPVRNYQIQRRPRKPNCLKIGSEFKLLWMGSKGAQRKRP